jgi:murein DD-endopeptidase MepM/ murein hydrolase activator NlpD
VQKKKATRKLLFEEEARSKRSVPKTHVLSRPVKATAKLAILKARRSIQEAQDDNVGTEAVSKGEIAAEQSLRFASTRRKLAQHRQALRLEHGATKQTAKAGVRHALDTNPRFKSSVRSRAAQRRMIKRDLAKRAAAARKTAQSTAGTFSGIQKALQEVTKAISRHPAVVVIALTLALLLVVIMASFSSCENVALNTLGTAVASSYLAEDEAIDQAELDYTEWETDIQISARAAEQTYPGYDEYRYSIGNVGHSPYTLMAYLTARYHEFDYGTARADLQAIFSEQYHLSFTPSIEMRTRTVTRTDPATLEDYDVEEQYEWRVLNITLTSRPFTDVILPRLSAGQVTHYSLLVATKGSRQYVGSPFAFNWLSYVSDSYGWRIHPISGVKENHTGVDIAVSTGTEILAAHDGEVTLAASDGGYGLSVVIVTTAIDGSPLSTRYAHCSELLVSVGAEVKRGDVIAKVGSTGNSTGPHLHFEIVKDGRYLNPLYFAIINDDGSVPSLPGQPNGPIIPAYPGAPMTDAKFAAMMTEAQKHLGKPYVFGGSGPYSFDCSGFVCYVINQSGVGNVGRIGAQGLFNICTPISPASARPGDLIFFTNTYDAGTPVTHIGIYIGNNQMIHAGEPVQYAAIDSAYFTQHFYAFGRLAN